MEAQESQNDQKTTGPSKRTLIASATLLLLPTLIPLLFITQTNDPTVIGIFVGTSVILLMLNLLLLRVISRWVKRLAEQQQ